MESEAPWKPFDEVRRSRPGDHAWGRDNTPEPVAHALLCQRSDGEAVAQALALLVEVYEGDQVIVKAVVPGARLQDLRFDVAGGVLEIRVETGPEPDIDLDVDRHRGLVRSVRLPSDTDVAGATAMFHMGVLCLKFPRFAAGKANPSRARA